MHTKTGHVFIHYVIGEFTNAMHRSTPYNTPATFLRFFALLGCEETFVRAVK